MDSSSQKNSFNRGRSPFHYIQVHLSTAVVMMFVASGLVWMNVSQYGDLFGIQKRGWPFTYLEKNIVLFGGNIPDIVSYVIDWRGVASDFGVVVAILGAVAFSLEWAIRRREARKP